MTTAARATFRRPDRQVMVVLGNAPTDLTASLRAAGLVRIALDDDIAIWATQSQATVPPGRTAAADPAPTSTGPPRLLMTVADAALALGLGRSTVYQLIGRGELEVIHVGRSARIPADDVHCLVERLRSRGPAGGLGATGA